LEYTLFDLFKDSDKKQGEDKDDSANLWWIRWIDNN
jgi:hypothetical protein